jgi:hypothetical protein
MSGASLRAVDRSPPDRRHAGGLPLVARPYHQLAEEFGIAPRK